MAPVIKILLAGAAATYVGALFAFQRRDIAA